ncbi:MAG TPA: hypothetical protein IAA88_09955 [Candidatus Avimuribaculum pullicola]|nr:hypothetical protein [Candidatus Avimuribaculum pullicola]
MAAKRQLSSRHNMSALQAMRLLSICVATEYIHNVIVEPSYHGGSLLPPSIKLLRDSKEAVIEPP